jgi:hypothetical protein
VSRWRPAALVLCAACHAGAAWLLLHRAPPPHTNAEPMVYMAALVAPPAPAVGRKAVSPTLAATAPAAMPASGAPPARPALHFYLPEKLEREPIVLRDRSGDAGITLAAPLVLQLFIDAEGRVVAVRFEGTPPPLALARQLRAAFGSIEFVPGVLHGRPVPARLRIELLPPPA